MNPCLQAYTIVWVALCLIALAAFVQERNSFTIFRRTYWQTVFVPWKVVTFLLAQAGLLAVASYAYAPDLDRIDGAFMAVLTFLTAPWVVAILFRIFKGESSVKQAYVAICLWLFCASWSFDAYIMIKDGQYPVMWPIYMLGTLGLYVLGGLFWNLEWKPDRGTIFAFMEGDWPMPSAASTFSKIVGPALLFMAAVGGLFLWFFWDALVAIVR